MSDPIAERVMAMLAERGPAKTLCPSEVARALAGPGGDWRPCMGPVHDAVDGLLRRGAVALSWQGEPLAKRAGPYRIGAPR